MSFRSWLWKRSTFILALILTYSISSPVRGQSSDGRKRVNIDFYWRFHLGDLPLARDADFSDRGWRKLDLPHDWSIEGTFSKDNPAGRQGGFLPTGIGWYRKHLSWQSAWEGKQIVLQFDGVYMNSDVWINGRHLEHHPYGYTSFYSNITPYLRKGDNVIAVRVDHSLAPSGRWYTGSGIYRHVWLTVTNPVHIPVWGSYVTTPVVTTGQVTVNVQTEVENDRNVPVPVTLETRLRNAGGTVVASTQETRTLKGIKTGEFDQRLQVEDPELWSPDHPTTYMVESVVKQGSTVLDTYRTRTGFRSFLFSADAGFVLNGTPMEINGMAMHHDGGAVGAAVPDDILYYRLKMLKDMGANAVRTAHNPQSPEFYAICDTLGLMVMDELFDGWRKEKAPFDYGLYFEKWWKEDATDFVLRDRNHPSVIMWSIGNEVPGYTSGQQKALADLFHTLDPTRPVTQGRAHDTDNLDLPGFNGEGETPGVIEAYHKAHPNASVIGTEMTHAYQTRGVYHTQTWYRTRDFPGPWEQKNNMQRWKNMKDEVHKVPNLTDKEIFTNHNVNYQSSYDNAFGQMNSRDQIRIAKKLPYLAGTFRWTGFDYIGESYGWPARAHGSGVIDLAGFAKDDYYLYQSQWSVKPMVHLLPYWTLPGKEGVKIPIVVYTNQESAELFLNGRFLGEKTMRDSSMQLVWQVPYEPGVLKVVAKGDGNLVVADSLRTALKAAAVEVIPSRKQIKANRRDVVRLEVQITDSHGTVAPTANNKVRFKVEGPARLIGVENGDVLDLSSNKINQRKAFMGKCLGLIQATGQPGDIIVTVRSEGLKTDTVRIKSN